ncbi:MAG: aminopeptidase [Ruminococcaceae bacterium]|nr:aminopeptidase [Oscillospiraceae bacterium]
MKKTYLREYARLLVKCGVAIKKGDPVIINAELDQPEFIKMLVEECYRAKASRVIVDWSYMPLTKLHVNNRSIKELGKMERFEEEKLKYRLEKNPAMLHIVSDDPDGLRGINQKKYAKMMIERMKIVKPYRDQMDNKYKWCIAAVPGDAWAKKIFPGDRVSVAKEKLWNAILQASRVIDGEGNLLDAVAEWGKHNESFARRCKILNDAGLVALKYKAANGTDLRVGLIENTVFMGGGEDTLGGEYYNPNIPTEEVFISPKAGEAEGIVYSSMPLSWRGEIIDNFSIKFEGGRAVEVHAEKNEELLKTMISMDEGAAMLGECAFVPYDSPIRQSGIMFYETLFDENAACHLALGRGFTNTVVDYDKYTNEHMKAMGINDSAIHVDFMIGTEDMSIVGIKKDGGEFVIFENGLWAF